MLSPKMLFNGLLIAGAAFCLAAPTELNTAEVIKAQAEVAASTTPGNEEMARRQLGDGDSDGGDRRQLDSDGGSDGGDRRQLDSDGGSDGDRRQLDSDGGSDGGDRRQLGFYRDDGGSSGDGGYDGDRRRQLDGDGDGGYDGDRRRRRLGNQSNNRNNNDSDRRRRLGNQSNNRNSNDSDRRRRLTGVSRRFVGDDDDVGVRRRFVDDDSIGTRDIHPRTRVRRVIRREADLHSVDPKEVEAEPSHYGGFGGFRSFGGGYHGYRHPRVFFFGRGGGD